MAAEDFKTLREVGIGIEGIKVRLNLMTRIFALSVLIGVGALGYVANRVDTVAEDIVGMKGQFAAFSQQLASIKAGVDALQQAPKQQGRMETLQNPISTAFTSRPE